MSDQQKLVWGAAAIIAAAIIIAAYLLSPPSPPAPPVQEPNENVSNLQSTDDFFNSYFEREAGNSD